jgi:RimJ/RimL family protein N-acetyltransferase
LADPFKHEIRTRRLLLRKLTVADVPRIHEILSNWHVTRMLRMAPFPPRLDQLQQWLSGHDQEWTAGTAYRFAVTAGERMIGCTDVDQISSGCGGLGYFPDEDCWGRGFASEAAEAVRDFAVEAVGLRRLLSGHAIDNPASGHILIKLGFRPTGEAEVWSQSRQETVLHKTYEWIQKAETSHS